MRSTLTAFRCTTLAIAALGLSLAACGSTPDPVVACGGTTGNICIDGQACSFSGDCQVGSICNNVDDPYFDMSQTADVCVKLVCGSTADCKDGKECTREKICQAPSCQADADCGGQICSGGACVPRSNPAQVVSCSVVTPDGAIRQGGTVPLAAIGKNANGKVLPGIEFTWMSSNAAAVSVAGLTATGGSMSGSSELTAKVTGNDAVTCDRRVRLENFATLAAGSARVVLVTEDNGSPVAAAAVTLFTGGMPMEAMTDTNGSVTFANVGGDVESVTVVKAGHEYVTVISPGTKDIFLPIPRKGDITKAGGYRGAIDVSKSRRGDLYLGITAPAIPTNLLNLDFAAILGDSINTTIDAPQLGLNDQMVDLPGGVVFRLGNERFTVDVAPKANLRCQGLDPGPNDLGCYVARAPAGPGIAWTIAGRLKLQDVASIAGKLSSAFGGGGTEDLPIGDILGAVLPLLRTLNHGINAGLNTTEFDKVSVTTGQSGGECANAATPDYADKCRGDFSKYAPITLAADTPLAINAAITIPELPRQADGTFADGVVVLSAAISGLRGLIPLGLTAGLDTTAKTQTADGKINGVEKPFGPFSTKLPDGQVPLTTAVPHSGIEGSKLALVGIALDPNSLGGDTGIQLSGLVRYVDSFTDTGFGSAAFLGFPTGTFNVAAGTFTGMMPTGSSVTRVEIGNGDKTWLVYVPGNTNTITLPNVAAARTDLLTGGTPDLFLQIVRSPTPYREVFEFGSGKNLDRAIELIEGFVIQECVAAATASCKIE